MIYGKHKGNSIGVNGKGGMTKTSKLGISSFGGPKWYGDQTSVLENAYKARLIEDFNTLKGVLANCKRGVPNVSIPEGVWERGIAVGLGSPLLGPPYKRWKPKNRLIKADEKDNKITSSPSPGPDCDIKKHQFFGKIMYIHPVIGRRWPQMEETNISIAGAGDYKGMFSPLFKLTQRAAYDPKRHGKFMAPYVEPHGNLTLAQLQKLETAQKSIKTPVTFNYFGLDVKWTWYVLVEYETLCDEYLLWITDIQLFPWFWAVDSPAPAGVGYPVKPAGYEGPPESLKNIFYDE
jgi:hypothetical protein